MIIQYDPQAKEDLAKIYAYGKETFGNRISKKFIERIRSDIKILKHSPQVGQIEEKLSTERHEYRSLLVSPYKIIYSVQGNIVRIHFMWHTSRNPENLGEFTK